VVVLPALNDEGNPGLGPVIDHGNAVLTEMVDAGAIGADERKQMVLGTYPRRRSELLAPFEQEGRFQNLRVLRIDVASRCGVGRL
jgi:hypothetical protein